MKLLKYILLFIFSLLLNRNVSATNVNHPNALHKKGDAVKALAKDNVNMANFGITTQTLANMRGNPATSYSQVCNKVNLLVDELPTNVSNLDKYLGAQGFSKTQTMYTKRHSWVQLERLLENADGLQHSIEVKNWANSNAVGYNQFKAYIISGKDFRYYYNGTSEAMKVQFQNVFKDPNKVEELWNANDAFFRQFTLLNGTNISNWQQIQQLAINNLLINHPMLNFIK